MLLTYSNSASQAGEKAGGDYLKVRYRYLQWVKQKSLEPGPDLGKLEIVGWEHGKEEEEKKKIKQGADRWLLGFKFKP